MMEAPPDLSGGAFSIGVRIAQGVCMNTLERRQIVRSRVIDVSVAKAAVHESRRQRAEAAKKLRKSMAASRYDAMERETISYSRQATG